MVGQKYEYLTVIQVLKGIYQAGKARTYLVCECVCGEFTLVRKDTFLSGNKRSCGCADFHGMSNTSIYIVWTNMIQRCTNFNNTHFPDYGLRGITVYAPWISSFKEFYNYILTLGPKPTPEHTLDRINNDGDYRPGNLKWSTKSEQQLNRRCCK